MRIDLYCHTKKCKPGNPPNCNAGLGNLVSAKPSLKEIEKPVNWSVAWKVEM